MGRNKKYWIDNFMIDTAFFDSDNEQMLFIRQKYGYIADTIYFKILALIYNYGYYYKFDSIEKLCAIIAIPYGIHFAKTHRIENIVRDLVEEKLFDKELFSQNILTSRHVQEFYLKSIERRLIKINKKYWLLDDNENTEISKEE